MTVDDYDRKIRLVNLSDVGQTAYSHSLENAKRFAAMPKDERDEREKIIGEILKEVQGD